MATAEHKVGLLTQINENFLVCAVCSERYDNAKSLPCLHSFCESCLSSLVKKTGSLICPLCRCACEVPSEGVSGLPNNFYVNELVEIFKLRGEGGQQVTKCGGCEMVGVEVRCNECDIFLCSACVRPHRRLSATRSHNLTPFVEYHASKSNNSSPTVPPGHENCPKHNNQPLSYYCDKCDEAICLECTVVDHRATEHKFRYLKDAAATFIKDLERLVGRIELKVNEARESLERINGSVEALNVRYDQEKRILNTHIEEIVKQLKDIGTLFEGHITSAYESRKKDLDKSVKELEFVKSNLEGVREYITKLSNSSGVTQLMSAKKAITLQSEALLRTETIVNPKDVDFVEFVASGDFANLDSSKVGRLFGTVDGQNAFEVTNPAGRRFFKRGSLPVDYHARVRGHLNVEKVNDVDTRRKSLAKSLQNVYLRNETEDISAVVSDLTPRRRHSFQFHGCHGSNVTLSPDRQSAQSKNTGNNIVFSHRSVGEGEKIAFKFKDNKSLFRRSRAQIFFGFTTTNPDSIIASELPVCAVPELQTKAGYWLACLPNDRRKVENTVVFWVKRTGQMKYSINGVEKEVSCDDVIVDSKEPVWAIVDFYSRIESIKLL